MTLIKLLVGLSILSLLIKIYYTISLNDDNKKTKVSAFAKMIGGVYGGGVIFPILRKGRNSKEKSQIQKANIAIILFWSLFLFAMILVLLSSES